MEGYIQTGTCFGEKPRETVEECFGCGFAREQSQLGPLQNKTSDVDVKRMIVIMCCGWKKNEICTSEEKSIIRWHWVRSEHFAADCAQASWD
mmetsp:Transcript_20884/g.57765  ORF Transcript_20884/g.57765 Transcript_20884/m.57765 type:complete len:92 (+) Transcript_20884:231-506(+)